jgi:hypothetical protein
LFAVMMIAFYRFLVGGILTEIGVMRWSFIVAAMLLALLAAPPIAASSAGLLGVSSAGRTAPSAR